MQWTEGALKLRPQNLRANGEWVRGGTMTWSDKQGPKAAVSFRVVEYLNEADVVLSYQCNGEPVEQRLPCEFYVQFRGGRRWCFLCGCNRRMEVLYLPAGRREFRCRRCYQLRYRSQERDLDWLVKPFAAETGIPRRVARKYLEAAGKAMADGAEMKPD